MIRFSKYLLLLILFFCVENVVAQRTFTSAADVLEANISATGGRTLWNAVTSIRWDAEIRTPSDNRSRGGSRISVYRYPGYRFVENVMFSDAGREVWTFVITPQRAWMETPEGIRSVPKEDMPALYHAKEEIVLLDEPRYVLEDLQSGWFNDAAAYCVTVLVNGESTKRYYDRRSYLLLGVEMQVGDQTVKTLYSDYRRVENGLQMPFRFETILPQSNGGQIYEISRIDINGRAGDSLFEYPGF